ncbi:uncharacterized protein LOC111385428 isoform X2 [Olea europaea var. sylvestris]|uniref:uncharacterized protein LOC111385428 isoform X2 n=1 Tax=Olea europaea var. sylvestris TaxID=158386 RepID=UPI000C1CF00A|nr:uncharacterized protein LOC111385428 isoform X2 [Olea europaea var. sylvestris]
MEENESAEMAQRKQPNDGDSSWLFKSIFSLSNKTSTGDARDSTKHDQPISVLSTLANSVISSCAKILGTSTEELQHNFDVELPDHLKKPPTYARNFLEFCSYKALHLAITRPNYLGNKGFHRLTFDMMLAWDAPGADSDLIVNDTASCSKQDVEDEDGWSLFYSNSTNMAVQVDDKKTVGPEGFARIAPACPIIADIITVHNLFDVLTSSSGHRLHFLIYDKYLRSLEKVVKSVQNVGPQIMSNCSLAEDEIIVDIDGTVPTQPVLQHVGMSAWPGRLTLTNYALYFESGVGLYDNAVRYDLSTDMKQVLKPELTGPLGARLFDKAVMYKSISIAEPVYLEFPEFKGSSRRDYWLDISLEILRAHKFNRKYNLKESQQSEALARAILGIFRYRALREALHVSSSNFKTLLCFNLAESIPGGYMIMETLSSCLKQGSSSMQQDILSSPSRKRQPLFPVALLTLRILRIISSRETDMNEEATFQVGDVCVGKENPLETIVKQLKRDTGRAEAAQATVAQVKVEGVDTNVAVMKELLFPLIELFNRLQLLVSWEDPYKSLMFVLLISYLIIRDWIRYMLPLIFMFLALIMLWNRHVNRRKHLEAFKIVAPPSKNPLEQLITLQDAIAQVEILIQSGNIILLKLRALLLAAAPQATDHVTLLLVFMAVAFAVVPLKFIMLLAFWEFFTRNTSLRKDISERWLRRTKEWWIRIPAAPLQLIKPDDKKRK